jgi:hypothetical protein
VLAQPESLAPFETLWQKFSEQVKQGKSCPDLTSTRPVYTLVGRLGEDAALKLREAVDPLLPFLDGHYIYPPGDIHTTILYRSP